jgi:hypothetical protein
MKDDVSFISSNSLNLSKIRMKDNVSDYLSYVNRMIINALRMKNNVNEA